MPSPNFGTDGLLATTLRHYIPRLEDNIFTSKPLLWALRQAGRIINFEGERIVQPLIYAEAANHGSYADDDVFATAANVGIGAAEYTWKQYYGLVHFTGIELAKNQGKGRLLSLMEARMQQVEMTIAENLNEMFFGNGTGNGGKDWNGLANLIDATSTVGNINRGTNAYWQAQVQNATTVDTLALADMRQVYNDASEGNDHPTNIFTTQTGFQDYEALLQPDTRYENQAMADGGFQNLLFKNAPITFDTYAGSVDNAPMYFLNLKYLTLAKLADVWFQPSDLLQPTNQDAWFKHLKCYGNVILSNSARQGKLLDIHA